MGAFFINRSFFVKNDRSFGMKLGLVELGAEADSPFMTL